jgi:two-component system chemotaxis response regulator CheB
MGGRLLVEAESTAVVYGMPRAVAEAKLGAEEVTLELMARAIADRI